MPRKVSCVVGFTSFSFERGRPISEQRERTSAKDSWAWLRERWGGEFQQEVVKVSVHVALEICMIRYEPFPKIAEVFPMGSANFGTHGQHEVIVHLT